MAVTPEFLAQEIKKSTDISAVFNAYILHQEGESQETFQQRKEIIIAQTMALIGKGAQILSATAKPKVLDIPIIVDCLGTPLTEGYVDSAGNTYDISTIDKIPANLRWQNNGKAVVNRALNDNLTAINIQFLKTLIAHQWIMENISSEQQHDYLQQEVSVSDDDYPEHILRCPILFDNFNPAQGTSAFLYEDGYSVALSEQFKSPFTNLPLRKKMGTPNHLLNKLANDYLSALIEYKQITQQYPILQAFVEAKIEEKVEEQKKIHALRVKETEEEKEAIQKYTRRLAIRAQLQLERNSGINVMHPHFQKINQECLFNMDRIKTEYPEIEKLISQQAIEQARQDFLRSLNDVSIGVLRQYDNVRKAYFECTDKIHAGSLTAEQCDKALQEQARLHAAQKEFTEKWPEIRYRWLLDQARGISIEATVDVKRVSLRERASMNAKKRPIQIHPPFLYASGNSNGSSTMVKKSSAINNPNVNSSAAERVINFASQTFSRFFSETAPVTPSSVSPSDYDYFFKILLQGDRLVGKSNLILRFADDIYTEHAIETIGDFKVKTITLNECRAKLHIWETERPERFRAIGRGLRGAHAIIVAFDVRDHKSFENVAKWLTEIYTFAGVNVIVTLAATKCDIPETEWAVSKEEIKVWAENRGKNVFFTSAKDNFNVEQLFEHVASSLMQPKSHSAPHP